jgi:valyl-tRNA synthetase
MTAPARKQLPPAYEPATVEGPVYEMWERGDYFRPRVDPSQEPLLHHHAAPNVTGELHLGHGLEDAITDALVRWHRMQGEPVLWVPGEDHAGIATQNVIERELEKEGLTRQDLGREAFVERTWMWVRKYRSRIADQHRKLGASADWSRDVFTLDDHIVKAVRKTFVDLYNEGLIYRGLRMINWCPRCETALSDLEVDYEDEDTKLWYAKYPMVGEGGMPLPDYVLVATTRPETMVADTGVAVNPEDERYEDKIGRMLLLPIIGREIPVVADDAVKLEFGTGAVKVTPGHDPNDWEIGQRHDLPVIVAMDRQARMNDEAGPYAGMTDLEARAAILRDLEDEGFLEHEEPYRHSVGVCSRCKTVLQPIPSEQWWLDVNKPHSGGVSLAKAAADAVRDGRITIVPQRFEKITCAGWTTSATGASRVSSGGAIRSRSGTAPTAIPSCARTTLPPAPSAAAPCARRRTCSTPGSAPDWLRTQTWAGRRTPRTSATSTPRSTCRWATTSCSSGAPGW